MSLFYVVIQYTSNKMIAKITKITNKQNNKKIRTGIQPFGKLSMWLHCKAWVSWLSPPALPSAAPLLSWPSVSHAVDKPAMHISWARQIWNHKPTRLQVRVLLLSYDDSHGNTTTTSMIYNDESKAVRGHRTSIIILREISISNPELDCPCSLSRSLSLTIVKKCPQNDIFSWTTCL